MIIGIDPGITGSISFLGETTTVTDMPTMPRIGKKGQQVDYHNLGHEIQAHVTAHVNMVYIEKVHAMPKQGVSSSFNFGMSYGAVLTAISFLGYPMTLVTPQAWKKRAGLLRSEKDAARTLAIQLFPELSQELKRKKDIGRADALLIAKFGAQNE